LSSEVGARAGADQEQVISREAPSTRQRAAVTAASPLTDRAERSDASAALAVSFTKMRCVELIAKDWGD
jgi:hypothetical protein